MRRVVVSGNRSVGVESLGHPDGTPVFLLHGTPGSRSGPRLRVSVLYRLGVRLICYDRPGYGKSDPHPGRTVADAARDVLAIADDLGVKQFGVVGRSGGGPHALACAALLGHRVHSVAILVGMAPVDAKGLDWFAGMTESNVDEYRIADADRAVVRARLDSRVEQIRQNPDSLLRVLLPELTAADRRVINDSGIRRQLADTYLEACRDGVEGWIDDVMALRRPWGFDLSAITVPVLIWHGADDTFAPVSHSYWLAEQIPTSAITIQPGMAHFGAVEILPKILVWIKRARTSEGMRVQGTNDPAFST